MRLSGFFTRRTLCAAMGLAAALGAMAPELATADVYLGLDGGLEGTATIDNTVYSSAQAGKWSKNNADQTIAEETTNTRSGAKSIRLRCTGTTGRRAFSPLLSFSSKTTAVTIQYYRMITNTTYCQSNQVGVYRDIEQTSGTYDKPASANTWEKKTYAPASRTFSSIYGIVMHRRSSAGEGDLYVDDLCIYDGGVDTTAPNSAGAITLTTNSATALVLSWGAASGGEDSGGYLVVRYTSNPGATDDPNVNGIYATNSTVAGSVSGTVQYQGPGLTFTNTGLTTSQTYYYKVYTYDKAYNYAAEVSASGTPMSAASAPTVSTLAASTTNTTTASVHGDVTADGGATVTDRGVCYKTTAGVAITDNKTASASNGTGQFTVSLSSLAVNQIYYYKAYATNTAGATLGSEMSFTTLANVPSAPTVNNPTASSLDIAVNENGNPASTEFAIQRTSDSQYLQSDGSWGASAVWATKATWGTKTATGLSASTTYYFQVKARNSVNVETAFGSQGSGTTSAAGGIWINPMSAGTPMGTYYLGDTMGSWNVNFEIGQASWDNAQVGIGTALNGTGYNYATANWYEDGTPPNKRVRRDLSGYQYTAAGSHYVICQARANSGDTYTSKSGNGWSNTTAYPPADLSSAYFTCSALNNPSAQSATAASSSQIDLSWTRGSSGGDKDTIIFRYTNSTPPTLTQGSSYSQGSTYSGYYCVYKGSGTSHNDSASLSAGTQYYYFFYAENYSYYSAGVNANATTHGPPTVSTTPAFSSNTTSIILGGNVTADGGGTVTNRGVVYKTTATVAISDNKTQIGSGTGAFSNTISSLSVNQIYYFRAYAQNSSGTTLGTELSFYTLANVPSAPTVNNPTATTLDVAVNENGNPASTEFAIQRTSDSNYLQADGSWGASAVWATKAGWGTKTATGLSSGTSYSIQVKARNGANEETAFGSSASGLTICGTPATPTASSVTTTGFTADWSASTGAASYRLDVATDSGFTSNVGGFQDLTVGGTSQAITNLTPGRTYYVRIRAVNASGTSANSATLTQAAACFTVGATINAATGISTTNFTANWTAVTGANGYQLDVSTNATFGGGGSVNLMSNAGFETGDSTDWDKFETEYSVVSTDPQEGTYHVAITATATRDLTQNVAITGDGVTAYEISYWYKGTGNARIWAAWTAGGQDSGDSLQPGSYNTATSEWTKMTYTVVPSSGNNTLFYEIRTYNGASMNFDNFFVGVAGGGGTPNYVPGFSNLTVSGTSQVVTGLTASTEYFYRVRATNAYCTVGTNSATHSVTTTAAAVSYALRRNGFEGTTSENWSWTASSTAVELGPRATTNAAGSYSLMLTGSLSNDVDPTITFDNVKMPPSATAVSVSVAYACSGADSGDDLYLEVSYDNGGTWPVSTQLIDGLSNTNINFGETVVGRTASANPLALALVDNATNVRVRIRYDEAAAGDNRFDEFYIDEVKLVSAVDGLRTVAFSGTETIQVETNTTAFNIPIVLSSAGDATVRVAIAGTAQAAGTDFTATSTNIVFVAGQSATTNLIITINNDSLAEGPESVRFTLTQADGCRIVGPDVHTLFIRDDDAFSIVAANLVNGTVTVGDVTAWGEAGQRLLRTLQPDIVAIQEWVITNASYQAFVDLNFGAGYYYVVDGVTGQYAIPNGIISRWPILETNIWDDTVAGYREHLHARIDLPGTKDLNLVSVHFKAGDTAGDIAAREDQAQALTNYIRIANFGTSNYLAIAGDLNQSNRTDETVLSILGNYVSDAKQPTTKSGSKDTNPADERPYDYVLPDAALEAVAQAVTYNGSSFADGFIFDTRE